MIRVAVAAPVMAMRAGLQTLLSDGEQVEVIAEAATLLGLAPLPPQLDVLVLVSPEASRSDLEYTLHPSSTPGVLFLVQAEPVEAHFLDGLPVRAWGILPIDVTAEELQAAVRALHEGLLVGAPELMRPLLLQLSDSEKLAEDPLAEPLTKRETEVLQLLSQGLANKQIALALGISEHTVKFHVSAIYAKLGATNRTEAVRLGVLRGLVVL